MLKRISIVILITLLALGALAGTSLAQDDVDSHLQEALTAAQAEDWDTVQQELTAALDLSEDAQERAAIEELLEDFDRGDYDEVITDLQMMLEAADTGMSPVHGKLQEALVAAEAEDWDTVERELNEALDLSEDAQERAAIEELLEDFDRGDYDEVITDLQMMLEQ